MTGKKSKCVDIEVYGTDTVIKNVQLVDVGTNHPSKFIHYESGRLLHTGFSELEEARVEPVHFDIVRSGYSRFIAHAVTGAEIEIVAVTSVKTPKAVCHIDELAVGYRLTYTDRYIATTDIRGFRLKPSEQ